MNQDFSLFKSLPTAEQANELKSLLNQNGIETVMDDNRAPFDITFSGSTVQDKYEVIIKKADFEKAESLLEKQAQETIQNINKNHYLFEFSNEELYEILLKPDEWNSLDYSLAQKILTDRGKSIDIDLLNSLKNERIKDLSKPEEGQLGWVVAGYFFSILGGFLGLIIGYFLWTSKKTLPNGEKVYNYTEKDRKHGKTIFLIGLIVLPILLSYRILIQIN